MDMMHQTILVVLFTPFIGLLLPPLAARHRFFYYAFMLLIPVSNIYMLLKVGLHNETITFLRYFSFSLDRFSYMFALLLNLAWIITITYTIDYIRYQFKEKKFHFYGWLFVSISVISATALADNLFTLLFFYLLAIPAVYPLITISGTGEAKKAGLWYLGLTVGPYVFILLPTFLYLNAWTQSFHEISIRTLVADDRSAALILALIILGFSKCCVAPFFPWLSRAAVSPAPVSALIHSVGSVHAGTIAVLKIALYLYGCEYLAHLSDSFFLTGWLIYLCGFTSIYTAMQAYKANNLKRRFSYSTVGQLSYILTAILVGTKGAVLGAILHIFSHTIAKMNLFFIAGAFSSLYGTVEASAVRTFVPHTRWLALATGISGLSITGFPLLAGYYSKDLMLIEEIGTQHYAAAVFLIIGSIMNFLYIYPVLKAAVVGKKLENFTPKRLPRGMTVAIILCCALIILFSQYVYYLIRFFQLE